MKFTEISEVRRNRITSFILGSDIPRTLAFFFPLYCLGFLSLLLSGNLHEISVGLMAAMACLGVGGALGFLFGIPQTARDPSSPGMLSRSRNVIDVAAESPTEGPSRRFQSNTNLEQVSDWVTKIIIGVSLVEFSKLKDLVLHFAQSVAHDMDPQGNQPAFAALLIIYFSTISFVFGYVLTRLYLMGAFLRAEHGIQEVKRQLEKDIKDYTGALLELIQKSVPPPPGGKTLAEDPHKGKFGGSPTANGRILGAHISVLNDDYCLIHLQVTSSKATNPLVTGVEFYLYPEHFTPPVVRVTPVDGLASLDRIAWGAFTVGAVTDDGNTRLELDLADLHEAPVKFRTR